MALMNIKEKEDDEIYSKTDDPEEIF